MELFKEVDVAVIGHPGHCTKEKGAQDYYFVDFHFGVISDVIFPDVLVKSAECTVHLSMSVVHVFINQGIRGYHTTQIGNIFNCFQLSG